MSNDFFDSAPYFLNGENSRTYGSTENTATSQHRLENLWRSSMQVQATESTSANAGNNGVTLSWSDLSVFVPVMKNPTLPCFRPKKPTTGTTRSHKRILANVTGIVTPGTLMAIVGASGAGKTTLMSSLSGRLQKDCIIDGEILINAQPVDTDLYRNSAFVHQHDLFVASLTAKEHIYFMARIRLGKVMTEKEIQFKVDAILSEFGLKKCADTRIGAPGVKCGLSGGERKRLAFAAEILNDPALLFCDEPTSGLDSFMAESVIDSLANKAAEGKTIVCSIHQPSSKVFSMFNKILILADGRTAFMGSPRDAMDFFESCGFMCPLTYNPSDFYLQTLACQPGRERSTNDATRKLCNEYSSSSYANQITAQIELGKARASNGYQQDTKQQTRNGKIGWCEQFRLLTWRSHLQSIRDPKVHVVRAFQKTLIAIAFSLIFSNISLNQEGITDIFGAVFVIVTENTFPSLYSVIRVFPLEFPLFLRETKNELYRVDAYYLSKVITLVPSIVVESIVFTVIIYWVIGLNPHLSSFFWTLAFVVLLTNTACACGYLFSASFNSIPTAMMCLVPVDTVLMIVAGVFINVRSVPPIISWAQYISWFRYSNEGINIAQWDTVTNITCDNDPNTPCLETGKDVLEKYGFQDGTLIWNIGGLSTLLITFHIIALFSLTWRASKN